jgi:hypothetical protein
MTLTHPCSFHSRRYLGRRPRKTHNCYLRRCTSYPPTPGTRTGMCTSNSCRSRHRRPPWAGTTSGHKHLQNRIPHCLRRSHCSPRSSNTPRPASSGSGTLQGTPRATRLRNMVQKRERCRHQLGRLRSGRPRRSQCRWRSSVQQRCQRRMLPATEKVTAWTRASISSSRVSSSPDSSPKAGQSRFALITRCALVQAQVAATLDAAPPFCNTIGTPAPQL